MSDVDAIRGMASEHDLEFVDLDTYGVDPAAGEILPASLSRLHHVVAIKRKFGTPVIATADPDDLSAHDMVRSSIGRDFISVVASRDQIGDYLDRLFGPEGDYELPSDVDVGDINDGSPPTAELQDDAATSELAVFDDNPFVDTPSDDSRSDDTPSDDTPFVDTPFVDTPSDIGPTDEGVLDTATADESVDEEPVVQANGKRRRRRDEAKQKNEKSSAKTEPEVIDEPSWQDLSAEPEFAEAVEALGESSVFGEESPESDDDTHTDLEPLQHLAVSTGSDEIEPAGLAEPGGAAGEDLEPATSLLPEFGAKQDQSGWSDSDSGSATGSDPLAELARSVQDEERLPDSDSTTLAADLVAEAVATYQEKHGEEQRYEAAAFDASAGTAMFPPLAKVLVEGDRVSLGDMEAVLEEHYRTGHTVARILTAQKLVSEADLMWGMAEEMGLDFVDLDTVGVDFAEAGTIPEATARHHNVIVIANDDGTPVVAASNPTDVFAMDDLRTIIGRSFIVVVATRSQISSFIGRAFSGGGDAANMAMEASRDFDGKTDEGVDDIGAVTEEAPIVRYVNLLILQALNERASDIHVEPTGSDLRIRYRIDGVLHDVSTAPRSITAAVTTRLKVMADMNVAEHRIPQDGRISLNVGSKGIDLRIATLPTIHGEKVVMRVLDKSSVVLGFPDLGFDEDLLRTYEGIYTKPYGTILVTGPTGSGKSTTLYTTLTALNSPEKNILTVEDPVELQLKGVNQVQLNVKAGLTFASALKSMLRSDPDIVLVGEIRDKETAVIAIEAALTGHMVLATLHTNSAAATPMRLIEMGIEPFLVTSSLSGALAQRLARRLCMHCKEAYEPTESDIAAAGWTLEEVAAAGGMPKVYKAVGCSACSNTGYRGRKALAELLCMTEEIERTIIEGGSVEEIHRIAVAQGMMTLRQSGLRKAIEGETTLEEVLRVVA